MRRGPRKKQDVSSSREEQRPPTAAVPTRRHQPPQEVLQQHQQRKKHQDEVTSLTTKNYRLAKELVCCVANYYYLGCHWTNGEMSFVHSKVSRLRMRPDDADSDYIEIGSIESLFLVFKSPFLLMYHIPFHFNSFLFFSILFVCIVAINWNISISGRHAS